MFASIPVHALFGDLSLHALPFYSPIALTGAALEVGVGAAILGIVTWYGKWRYLWNEWLTSVDHKRIGIMYVALALVMLLRGFSDAIMMRTQQALAYNSPGFLPPDHFN
jgi:cytochrome o ubiquinol oxidase subunit I